MSDVEDIELEITEEVKAPPTPPPPPPLTLLPLFVDERLNSYDESEKLDCDEVVEGILVGCRNEYTSSSDVLDVELTCLLEFDTPPPLPPPPSRSPSSSSNFKVSLGPRSRSVGGIRGAISEPRGLPKPPECERWCGG